jgi:hypothetical protein
MATGTKETASINLVDRATFRGLVLLWTVRKGLGSLLTKSSSGFAHARRRLARMAARRSPGGGLIGTPGK